MNEANFLSIWLEGLFYGLYSGIFAIYLRCQSERSKSRMAIFLFYAVCLLYVLSTASFVSDLVALILETHIATLPRQLRIDSQIIKLHIFRAQVTAYGCCDFLAQCILIYRCWIVWNKNSRVTIIPSFFAIAYIAMWLLGTIGATTIVQNQFSTAIWGSAMIITSLTASMAVNALVTGLIVFKIFKVLTPAERTLGSTGGSKLRHVIFMIIESGMALFAIQLIRLVFSILPESLVFSDILDYVVIFHQMLNGVAPTIILVRASMKLSFDDKEPSKEATGSLCLNNPSSDLNTSSSTSTWAPKPGEE